MFDFEGMERQHVALQQRIDSDLHPIIAQHAPYGVLGSLERWCREHAQKDPADRELAMMIAERCKALRAELMQRVFDHAA